MVHRPAVAWRNLLHPLWLQKSEPEGQAQDHALPLPRAGVQETLQSEVGDVHAVERARLSRLALCPLPCRHKPEECFEHEAPQGN